jgi:hypothetical protein
MSFMVTDVRSLSLDVCDDAWPAGVPDPDHPKHAAHALITGLYELGSSAQLRRRKAHWLSITCLATVFLTMLTGLTWRDP